VTFEYPDMDPSVPVHLTKLGMLKDGELNREWFEQSLKDSRRAVEEGKAAMAAEMIDEAQEFLDDN
jgi:hypothetical protein